MSKFVTGVIIGGLVSYAAHRVSMNMLKASKRVNDSVTAARAAKAS